MEESCQEGLVAHCPGAQKRRFLCAILACMTYVTIFI